MDAGRAVLCFSEYSEVDNTQANFTDIIEFDVHNRSTKKTYHINCGLNKYRGDRMDDGIEITLKGNAI